MNKNLFILLFLAACQAVLYGQSLDYEIKTSIPYYSESIRNSDPYIGERCVLDIYYPKNTQDFATIVWFHGGGLTGGSKEIPQALKEKGFCVVGVNYRLHPQVQAPEYIKDAAAAVAWVFQNIQAYGGDDTKIFVSGHSAGGYLAAMVGLDKNYLAVHDIDANQIAGIIPFSGQTITHFTIRKERGIPELQAIIDEYAPIYHVRKDAAPLLLITGDREMELLGRYEENAYLLRMMKLAGHQETRLYELDGYGHDMTEPAFPLLFREVNRIVKNKQ